MKNWKLGVEYVFYVPMLDQIYSAKVISKSQEQIETERRFSTQIDLGGPTRIYFNPDVMMVIEYRTGKFRTLKNELLGVL